jgi:hypothetical protein
VRTRVEVVARLEPFAAPRPIPLPVLRGEGGNCYGHDRHDKPERRGLVAKGCARHLMQHTCGEARRRQMRMDLWSTERQAGRDALPGMPLKLCQLLTQGGQPGAPVGGDRDRPERVEVVWLAKHGLTGSRTMLRTKIEQFVKPMKDLKASTHYGALQHPNAAAYPSSRTTGARNAPMCLSCATNAASR